MAIKINKSLLNGVVIEEGNNDNGYYIKYDNGTMICTSTKTISEWNYEYKYHVGVWTYPKAFIETPNVFSSAFDWSTYSIIIKTNPIKEYCSLMGHIIDPVTNDFIQGSIYMSLFAIGRWK